MLKKLRKQFIVTSMLICIVVVLSGIITLVSISYSYQKRQTLKYMQAALDNFVDSATPVNNQYYSGNNESQAVGVLLYTIVTDSNGNILSLSVNQPCDIASNGDVLTECIYRAVRSNSDKGYVRKYSMRFLKEGFAGGDKIVLADVTQERSNLNFQIRMYLFGSIALLAIAFLIIYIMSKRAIEPVAISIRDQKRFIADASHELKTPLTVILANNDILESDLNATIGERKKWVDSTKSEANRMKQLINEMLYLARADAGIQPQFNFRRINLSNVVDACVLTCEALAFENKVNLKARITPNVRLIGDEANLKQVFMVLIENAMKYVNPGGNIKVVLEVPPMARGAKISVINSGTPIPENKVEHLFDRFYRADESRTREKGGYGLGLSIAQNIVEQHHGEIGLDYSDAEHGTCFAVRLPLESSIRSPKPVSDK